MERFHTRKQDKKYCEFLIDFNVSSSGGQYQETERSYNNLFRFFQCRFFKCWCFLFISISSTVQLDQVRHVHRHFINLSRVILFNISQNSNIVVSDKVDCNTLSSISTGSTDSVDVQLTIVR